MGFVNYVYPSARHSRFEHSLGVAILAGKVFEYAKKKGEHYLSENDLIVIRLAALLHDVGHCLFSHTSELVYSKYLDNLMEEEFIDLIVDPAPHEFLSYLIITSDSFKKYFDSLNKAYKLSVDPNEIAIKIIGGTESESKRYITSIINGPFDADKIDYFHRDSQFSGIPIQLDLDRLFYEIRISDITELAEDNNTETVNDLTVGISGVTCIEQIIFNKMLLYSTIYNHHKVQAIDCMFKGIFEHIEQNHIQLNICDKERDFSSPIDFLYLVDHDFFSFINETNDLVLKRLIQNILNRDLLKRALVINRSTIIEGNLTPILSTKANKIEKDAYLRELAHLIHAEAKADCDPSEIWIDIPKIPSFKEASITYVRTNRVDQPDSFKQIGKFYPYNQFRELYELHKLNGHVFAPGHCVNEVAKSARKVFFDKLRIKFADKAIIYN